MKSGVHGHDISDLYLGHVERTGCCHESSSLSHPVETGISQNVLSLLWSSPESYLSFKATLDGVSQAKAASEGKNREGGLCERNVVWFFFLVLGD